MCLRPSKIWLERGPKYELQEVPCKACWQCKAARINDFIGRSLAEASTSAITCTVSLTYAPRLDLADKVLHPRHFQLFIKLLRRAGHKIRYLVAGEYGDLKGRAHFHAILFFEHLVPSATGEPVFYNPEHILDPSSSLPFSDLIPQKANCHIREWPHGHIFTDWNADEASIRYVCNYVLADEKKNGWLSMSKKPALGAAYFAQKAAEARALGVLPSHFVFSPPGGSPDRTYPITGASRRDYLRAITTDPSDRKFMGEWCLKSFDKFAKSEAVKQGDQWVRDNPDLAQAAFLEQLESAHALNAKAAAKEVDLDRWAEFWQNRGGDPRWVAMICETWGLSNVQEIEGFALERLSRGRHFDGSPILAPGASVQHLSGCSCQSCLSGIPPVDYRRAVWPDHGQGGF